MFEDEFVDKIEEGKEYKLGVLYEFISQHKYHLYSKSIGVSIGYSEQKVCRVNRVINEKHMCLSDTRNAGVISHNEVNGILFAELI